MPSLVPRPCTVCVLCRESGNETRLCLGMGLLEHWKPCGWILIICKNKEVKLLNHISLIKDICVLVNPEELN